MYTPKQLEKIHHGLCETLKACDQIRCDYIVLAQRLADHAYDHAVYGIARRVGIVMKCLDTMFNIAPPNLDHEIQLGDKTDLDINLHAFLLNICAIPDNMAWLWAHCKKIDTPANLEKMKNSIGLFHKGFSDYLPQSLKKLVNDYNDWYEFATYNRHPTAHRIPPYCVPYTNSDLHDDPKTRDYTLFYAHLSETKKRIIPLHPQCIADVNTINELLRCLLIEIDYVFPNNRLQGTLHKVSDPLNRDVGCKSHSERDGVTNSSRCENPKEKK
jgi:hypothetical protein